MSKFYIHIDDQQQGPFTTDELKDLKIARETMVWFEGEEDWKKAVEIEELQEIIKSIPPPIVDKEIEDAKKSIDKEKPSRKKKGLTVVVFVILLIGALGSYWYIIQQAKQVEMLRQIEEQKIKIQELEDIKADRLAEEQKQKKLAEEEKEKIDAIASQRQLELESLYYELNQAITNLRAAEIRLNEIQEFRLLRTPSKKQQQIQQQLEYILAWENEVDRLKMEIDKTRNR
jgi:cell division protein FtsB